MNKAGLKHTMGIDYVYAGKKGQLTFKVGCAAGDIKQVYLYHTDKYLNIYGEAGINRVKMKKIGTSGEHDYFEVDVEMDVIAVRYFFEVEDYNGIKAYLCDKGVKDEMIEDLSKMYDIPQQPRESAIVKLPKWMETGIVYQIFPDRFYRGEKYLMDSRFDDWNGQVKYDSHLGGSIVGIKEKLDYLKALGVNIIYLNPVFLSPSNHKYDTTDYFEIDPTFGTKADFEELVKEIHKLDMKIVIDGVFNHCGYDFVPFQDVVKNGKDSRFVDWFHISSFPINNGYSKTGERSKPSYETFGYYGGMPKLNMANGEVKDYIFKLTKYWSEEFDIDGWRLDASDEISFDFWREFRKHIKSINKEIGLIGEIWYDASQWLMGDQYDSVMNYKFRTPVVDFVAAETIKAKEFSKDIQYTRCNYKKPMQLGLWNLIGSHDTERFITLCGDDVRKLKLAAGLQFTLQGNPVIYYGDEIGMAGHRDPDCRRGMIWETENQNHELLNFYKTLIRIRKEHPVLVTGIYKEIAVNDEENLLIYDRINENETIRVIVNNGNEPIQTEHVKGEDLLRSQDFDGKVGAKELVIMKLL